MKSSTTVKITSRRTGRDSIRIDTRIVRNGSIRRTSKVVRVK